MSKNLFDIKDKIALVTGSSKGLGYTLAEGMGQAGVIPILNSRTEMELVAAVKKLRSQDIHAHGYAFDVTDEDAVIENINRIIKDVGEIDILINNAGIQIRNPLETFDTEDWQQLLKTNLTAVFLVSREVAKKMLKRKSGKIINICSIQSELGRCSITPYAASKGGIKMLTKGMATEWGKYNIQVNGIGPGYFVTEMTRPLVENKEFDEWLRSRTPANRWGKPAELIGAAIFLSSRASDYVNGHILYVDGGMLPAWFAMGERLNTDVADKSSTSVHSFELGQNYPNPFNPETTIQFNLAEQTFVSLLVFDLQGREVANLVNRQLAVGRHTVKFNASQLPSGLYLYQMKAGGFTQTKKLSLLK